MIQRRRRRRIEYTFPILAYHATATTTTTTSHENRLSVAQIPTHPNLRSPTLQLPVPPQRLTESPTTQIARRPADRLYRPLRSSFFYLLAFFFFYDKYVIMLRYFPYLYSVYRITCTSFYNTVKGGKQAGRKTNDRYYKKCKKSRWRRDTTAVMTTEIEHPTHYTYVNSYAIYSCKCIQNIAEDGENERTIRVR